MTRRVLFAAVITTVALLVPATATAKGPSEATITGPGLNSPMTFTGNGEGGFGAFGTLVSLGGFFPQTFGQSPDPVLRARPTTSLGPRYSVTYLVPGPSTDTLKQDLYPYAAQGPVTYMDPGQRFWGDQKTHGGWFRGAPQLKDALIEAGLPKKAPAAHGRAANARKVALGAGAGIVLAGAFLLLRRRR